MTFPFFLMIFFSFGFNLIIYICGSQWTLGAALLVWKKEVFGTAVVSVVFTGIKKQSEDLFLLSSLAYLQTCSLSVTII